MNILVVHPNCPGQFVHLAPYLASNKQNKVVFLCKTGDAALPGVTIVRYKTTREASQQTHAYLKPAEEAVLEGQAALRTLDGLRQQGFVPDIVIGHPGWGSMLYIKDLYPNVPMISYFEWYYQALHSDAQWWDDEKMDINDILRVRTKNAHHLLSLNSCDIGYCPTEWQKSRFPQEYQHKLKVVHDGINTNFLQPKKDEKLILEDLQLDLSDAREIVTYVARGFEAYRGFPQFMDAVRILTNRNPELHVVIVGTDRTCYGAKPSEDKTYKQIEEEKGGYDASRVHFTGIRNRADYLKILQCSDAHVYLTRPFVLSWSMMEAMAVGCPLVASATPPVEEVVTDGVNGLLVNFRSPEHIALRVEEVLADKALADRIGKAARETILEKYDLKKMLQAQLNMIYLQLK